MKSRYGSPASRYAALANVDDVMMLRGFVPDSDPLFGIVLALMVADKVIHVARRKALWV